MSGASTSSFSIAMPFGALPSTPGVLWRDMATRPPPQPAPRLDKEIVQQRCQPSADSVLRPMESYFTVIRRGCAFGCFGITISNTPLRPDAFTFSASAVSGRMKRR